MYWPSFNAGYSFNVDQHRIIMNTIIALAGSCTSAFFISMVAYGKLDMQIVLRATLAGGVAIGTASDLVVATFISLIIGVFAGILSAVSFWKVQPLLARKLNLHDTCGVHNLHGLPGILGAVIGAICAANSNEAAGEEWTNDYYGKVADGSRTLGEQAGF